MPYRMILLVARPTPAGFDRRSLTDLAGQVAERLSAPVAVAHLDQAEPSVHTVLDEARATGVGMVVVVPLAVPADAYLRSWTARAVANWRETRDADRPEVRFTADPATSDGLADVVATLALGATEPVTASPAAFRSPAWSTIDPHDRHLLVCRGPRCTAYGAGDTHRALAAAARGTPTLVTPTGCLGPCNLGPLVVEHPAGIWHQDVDTTRAHEIAATGRSGH
jgi:(2Fe-2S) ferredoxin